jgi:hypothetical protein
MTVQKVDTAVVFIDPQNDVLSEQGMSWEAVAASVIENNTRENIERIFKSAKATTAMTCSSRLTIFTRPTAAGSQRTA